MRITTLRRLRPFVQLAAFLLFLLLALGIGRTGWLPADLFFRLDPLVGLAHMLAARQIVSALLIGALIVLVATLVLGRVWCGWLCPLGAVLDVASAAAPRSRTSAARASQPREADLSRAGARSSTSCWR